MVAGSILVYLRLGVVDNCTQVERKARTWVWHHKVVGAVHLWGSWVDTHDDKPDDMA